MSADRSQFWRDLERDMEDPEFAREYATVSQEIHNRQQDARSAAGAELDPVERYRGTPDLEEVGDWSDEVDGWIDERAEQSDLSSDPLLREQLLRRAWLLRGLSESAWRYQDLN